MAFSLYAADKGHLDDIELTDVREFEEHLHQYIKVNHPDLCAEINRTGDYNDQLAAQMDEIIKQFKASSGWK
jgi:F-type H+-transporting ATPase subunit alpha